MIYVIFACILEKMAFSHSISYLQKKKKMVQKIFPNQLITMNDAQ